MSPVTPTASSPKLSIFTLAMINVAAILSVRGLPAGAEYGLSSAVYYSFAAVFFLIPVSLVAAELATAWPQKGGVFRWVGEAFGPRWGFLAIWLQWVQSTIWFPTALTFAAVALAFTGPGQRWDEALSGNRFYTLAIVLAVYWSATFVNFRGMTLSGAISKWGVIIGSLIPGLLIIVLGFLYYFQGQPVQIQMSWDQLFPNLDNFSNVVLAISILLFFAGMEMSAVHVTEVDNPTRNYPLAIFLAALIIVVMMIFGTLGVAFIIPHSQINLTQSLLVGYGDYFRYYDFPWIIIPIIALCLGFGVFGQVSTWIAGPSKGLLSVGKAGYLPPFFQKTNAHGVQIHILLVQAWCVTFMSIMFVILPSVQAAYQILTALAVTLYLTMYVLMFAAAISLRHSQPQTPRPYQVPCGDGGMWLLGGGGLVISLIAYIFGFLPPAQIAVGSPAVYIGILVFANILFVAIPFIIYACRKPHWKTAATGEDAIEPFSWEKPTVVITTPDQFN